MYQTISTTLLAFTTLLLAACNTGGSAQDDGNGMGSGNGGSIDTTTKLEITASNKDALLDRLLEDFADQAPADDPFSPLESIDEGETGAEPKLGSTIIQCTTGTAEVTRTGVDVYATTVATEGQAAVVTNYDNCIFDLSAQGFEIISEFDGTERREMSWTGFDGSYFDSYTIHSSFESFYFKESTNQSSSQFMAERDTTKVLENYKITISHFGWVAFPDIGEGRLDVSTDEPIIIDTATGDNNPDTGSLTFSGANNSQIVFTIVANGVQVTVNNGQPTLHEWSDITTDY